MNNIGNYDFTEKSKEFILILTELTNQDEKFAKDALRYICLKSFNQILNSAEASILEELKKYADNPEMFQSYFRTKFEEEKVRQIYTNIHNEYIDGFIESCGGSYTDEVIEQIKKLKF